HSLFFVALFVLIGLVRRYQGDKKGALLFYVIAAGWFIHLPLDCFYGETKNFFWPWVSTWNFCPHWDLWNYAAAIDAVLLVVWLVHEEVYNKVKDYF
ncbi:TPA: hypothetical protein HA234_04815, partial [Candidatus Woesearchaeota archaeon]|nr:hypothetical protein [Candidatus Woesearchaeota archaeon]